MEFWKPTKYPDLSLRASINKRSGSGGKREASLAPSPSQACVLVEPVMRWSLSIVPLAQAKAAQGSCRGSLQSPVNFSNPKALNQIFNLKLNSKINIKVEWLWNPLHSFVICFR